jgi:flagellar basal-body rod protein FlgB
MDISEIASIDLMRKNIRYLSARQSVLASNIAHLNTPNYRPRDVVKPSFKLMLAAENGGDVVLTSPMHMNLQSSSGLSGITVGSQVLETTPVGNSVIAEDEILKQSETSSQYSATIGAYTKTLGLLRIATGTDR